MNRSIQLKKNGIVLGASFFVAAIFILATVCQGSQDPKNQDKEPQQTTVEVQQDEGTCGPLVKQTCERCHYLTRVCQSLDRKKKRHWKKTVKIMAKNARHRGISISKDDQKKIIECLSSRDPEVTTLCEEYR